MDEPRAAPPSPPTSEAETQYVEEWVSGTEVPDDMATAEGAQEMALHRERLPVQRATGNGGHRRLPL